MRDRFTIFCAALALAGLLIGGCGAPDGPAQRAGSLAAPTAAPQAAAPADQLYVRDDDGSVAGRLAILGGTAARELPLGAIAPDWSAVYSVATIAAYGPQKTVVQALDLKTGRPLRETTIDGAYVLPSVSLDGMPGGLSPNGSWLVLRGAPGQPAGAAQGQFVVLDS